VAAFVGRRAASLRFQRPPLLVLSALFIAACGPPPDVQRIDLPLPEDADISERLAGRHGGVFVESDAQEPKTFNPMISEDAYSARAIGLMQSSLTNYDPVKEEVVPALARDWEIGPDNKVYTFHLRRGLRWSDGHSVTKNGYVQTEFRLALTAFGERPPGSIYLIPVRLDDSDRGLSFRDIHWINLWEEGGLDRLARDVGIALGGKSFYGS
jgi:hypothetical protein